MSSVTVVELQWYLSNKYSIWIIRISVWLKEFGKSFDNKENFHNRQMNGRSFNKSHPWTSMKACVPESGIHGRDKWLYLAVSVRCNYLPSALDNLALAHTSSYKVNVPRKGRFSDTWGVLSDKMRRNTENDSRIVIDSDSFSPHSTGTKNVKADRNARTTVGTIMLSI